MTEHVEIGKAISERLKAIQTPGDREAFSRDFKGANWFWQHPVVEPVAQIYYYDFSEKRIKEHR